MLFGVRNNGSWHVLARMLPVPHLATNLSPELVALAAEAAPRDLKGQPPKASTWN